MELRPCLNLESWAAGTATIKRFSDEDLPCIPNFPAVPRAVLIIFSLMDSFLPRCRDIDRLHVGLQPKNAGCQHTRRFRDTFEY